MCKYLTFKGPQQQLQCLSTLLSKGPPTATSMRKYLAFKGATNSSCNMQVPCSQRAPSSNFNM